LVDDNVEGELNSEIELFLKENCLTVFDVGIGEEEGFGPGGGATCGSGGG
jgi:ribose 5-phosphate isomerase RpiB